MPEFKHYTNHFDYAFRTLYNKYEFSINNWNNRMFGISFLEQDKNKLFKKNTFDFNKL